MVITGAHSDDRITPLEENNRKVSYEIALESMVLLKNDGSLPITSKKVALYGNGVTRTIKGGTGSGEVHDRHVVSIYEGMQNAGKEITSQGWLDDYEREFIQGEENFARSVKQSLTTAITHLDMAKFSDAFGMSYEYPYGRNVTGKDYKESCTDTCFYVISRQCGESMDRNPDSFMFHLTDKELDDIRFCGAHYEHMIVVLDVGASMDISKLDEIPGISAILYMGMLGCEAGNAFASVVCGDVTPSGHLTETWVKSYDDVPFGRQFGKMSKDALQQNYQEGIYVGYRYYDTFHIPVQYPFGYGLSYTSFVIHTSEVVVNGGKVNVTVNVVNSGTKYAGKQVVQLYLSKPQGRIEQPYQQLAGFAKTRMLSPGESENVHISFDLMDFGSYYSEKSVTALEPGKYVLRIGDSSQNTYVCGTLELEDEIVISIHKGLQMNKIGFEELHAQVQEEWDNLHVPNYKVSLNPMSNTEFDYEHPYPALDTETERIIEAMNVDECIQLVVGDGLDLMGKPHDYICPGAVGYTTSELVKKGIPLLIFSDGPAGLRIQKVNALKKNRIKAVEAMGDIFNYLPHWIFRMMHADAKKSKLLYQFTTSFPVGNMIAQTWNTDLLEKEGNAVSAEMREYGIHFWLAPGMNIHRNPLNGRNYEYYSEDPFLSGMLAAAVTKGVQSKKGTYVTLKHFCCNSQEEQRGLMSANVSERAMREIYLKGFEIAIKKSKPKGIMTSYNKCNQLYNNCNRELLEDVLRCEWKYDGLVMTDWYATGKMAADASLAISAGNDLLMPGTKNDKKVLRNALKNGTLSETELRKCAGNIVRIARVEKE